MPEVQQEGNVTAVDVADTMDGYPECSAKEGECTNCKWHLTRHWAYMCRTNQGRGQENRKTHLQPSSVAERAM